MATLTTREEFIKYYELDYDVMVYDIMGDCIAYGKITKYTTNCDIVYVDGNPYDTSSHIIYGTVVLDPE
ncbi:hypothetical protein EHS13_02595 [Paenibacillus psychroresistens]|uniref:Uncharacterized protein n=1 Tax=Paenibacillus psychroresistens TaxID=1778678 RepID=A0A6B8REH6_9BACL|nr:hypothetical protein [Paenibacillus psychroresistens]QGQ93872.1 hypothetical protein EHS13_02595 [Paenibacillus psychroresistens]